MKKIVLGSLATVLAISGAIGINAFAEDDVKISTEQSKKLIGIEKAIEVALKKANGTVESVELETEHSNMYYEVDIDGDKNKEYEVKVDAYTAKVINVRESLDDDENDINDDKALAQAKSAKSLITEKKAIAIAKKQMNGDVKSIELDSDDGTYEYEIKLQTKKGEAEITINASTGTVLEVEFDDNNEDD